MEGRRLEFPIRAKQGNLYITDVPKPPTELTFEKTKIVNVYNHVIEFETEIEKAELTSYAGKALIIRNKSNDYVNFEITSPDHGKVEKWLPPNRYFLITHPRPKLD